MRLLPLLIALSLSAQDKAIEGAARADWPHHGGTQLSWRYSALDQNNTTNVKDLAPAWIFQTGDYGDNLQATPIVVDGVMYISTPFGSVFALDAAAGQQLWQYKYNLSRGYGRPGSQAAFRQNRGVAVSDGKVFFGTAELGGMLGRHRHRGPVFGYVLEGSWRYLEHDWIAYISEAPGSVHTLVSEDPNGKKTVFWLNGPLEFLDEHDHVLETCVLVH